MWPCCMTKILGQAHIKQCGNEYTVVPLTCSTYRCVSGSVTARRSTSGCSLFQISLTEQHCRRPSNTLIITLCSWEWKSRVSQNSRQILRVLVRFHGGNPVCYLGLAAQRACSIVVFTYAGLCVWFGGRVVGVCVWGGGVVCVCVCVCVVWGELCVYT